MRTLLLGLLALTACGDQTIETDDTEQTQETDAPGYMVEVAADGQTAEVDLSDLSLSDLEGEQVVLLTDVLEASGLQSTWSRMLFDFEAADGYRPSTKDCGPVDHATLSLGGLHAETGNLTWAPSLGHPGCFYVDGVVLVDALPSE